MSDFDEGQIIEYHSFYWHAHECKYAGDLITGEATGAEIRERDEEKLKVLKEHYPIRVVWECEVDEELRQNQEMAQFFENYEDRGILQMDRALFGRTEVFQLEVNNKNKKLCYNDVVSLYPFIMKTHTYPIDPPREVKEFKLPMTKLDDIFWWIFAMQSDGS
ncbi:hypothetical protein L5515_019684 [Caenorhabditis briggsae]|uniref:DNA-directed DNA polymerase n=1 Tax=Caenorhabditis briggsae TaxID=6238 RepID=A0AAE9JVP7_CAEBR|nr:hypothetical protein L5515_019684 [Caenorhabditis briggsae]